MGDSMPLFVCLRFGSEHLNVLEHVMSSVVSCQVDLTPDAFPFQKFKEALGDGIVMLGSRLCWRRKVCHSRLVNWEP